MLDHLSASLGNRIFLPETKKSGNGKNHALVILNPFPLICFGLLYPVVMLHIKQILHTRPKAGLCAIPS